MTSNRPDNSRRPANTGIFRGRKPGPLISSLACVLIVAVLIRILERWAPVLHDVLVPIYWIIATIALIVVARWLRAREGVSLTDVRESVEKRTLVSALAARTVPD